jgi:hypothetical protein
MSASIVPHLPSPSAGTPELLTPPSSSAHPSDEVARFCQRHGLERHLATAIELAKSCFSADDVGLRLQGDPEGSGEWLVIDAPASGAVTDVLKAYRLYKDRLIEVVPRPQRDLLRVAYHIR